VFVTWTRKKVVLLGTLCRNCIFLVNFVLVQLFYSTRYLASFMILFDLKLKVIVPQAVALNPHIIAIVGNEKAPEFTYWTIVVAPNMKAVTRNQGYP